MRLSLKERRARREAARLHRHKTRCEQCGKFRGRYKAPETCCAKAYAVATGQVFLS